MIDPGFGLGFSDTLDKLVMAVTAESLPMTQLFLGSEMIIRINYRVFARWSEWMKCDE